MKKKKNPLLSYLETREAYGKRRSGINVVLILLYSFWLERRSDK
jgi:hypothetical protein